MVAIRLRPPSTDDQPTNEHAQEEHLDAHRAAHGEGRVAGPTGFKTAQGHAQQHQHGAGDGQPEGESVQAGESHIARADQQRYGVVADGRAAQQHRGDQDHAVQADQGVELDQAEELHACLGQLDAEDQREDAAHHQQDQREHRVLDADHLVVIADAQVAPPAGRLLHFVRLGAFPRPWPIGTSR